MINIIFIDNDRGNIEQTIAVVKNLRYQDPEKLDRPKPLSDIIHFDLKVEQNATPVTTHDIGDKVIEELKNSKVIPELIMVDLNFSREGYPDDIYLGVTIAKHIREHIRGIPVGVYTHYKINQYQMAKMSFERFSLVLDNLHKVTTDPKLENRFNGDKFFKLFSGAINSYKRSKSRIEIFEDDPPLNVKWLSGHPKSRSKQLRIVGPIVVDHLLKSIGCTNFDVTISQLSGGFSGSYLLKVNLQKQKISYLVKLDEDPNRLGKELDGLQVIQKTLEPSNVIAPLTQGNKPYTLFNEIWAAFIMPYDTKSSTLFDLYTEHDFDITKVYKNIWCDDCLYRLYGSLELKNGIKEASLLKSSLNKAKACINKHTKVINGALNQKDELIILFNQIKNLEKNLSKQIKENNEVNMYHASYVHGDLNCRNILIDNDNKENIRIIDYPNVKPNPLPTDFVKAECELLMLLMDRQTGLDSDIFQITVWFDLLKKISLTLSINKDQKLFDNYELDKAFGGIVAIRNSYQKILEEHDQNTIGRSYQILLIKQLLQYPLYEDVTIPKSLISLIYANMLIENYWN